MKFKYGDNVLVKGKVLGIVGDGIEVSLIDDASNSNAMWFAEEQLIPDMTNVETIPQEEVMKSAYDEGLNDAWKLVYRIREMDYAERITAFGNDALFEILRENTPQEALAKLKAYEDSKIEVGDEVICKALTEFDDRANKENYGVVTGIYSDHYEILMKNGDTTGFKLKECEKTGKHIDIQQILEQIGEQR